VIFCLLHRGASLFFQFSIGFYLALASICCQLRISTRFATPCEDTSSGVSGVLTWSVFILTLRSPISVNPLRGRGYPCGQARIFVILAWIKLQIGKKTSSLFAASSSLRLNSLFRAIRARRPT
jgi:hypothetical protein